MTTPAGLGGCVLVAMIAAGTARAEPPLAALPGERPPSADWYAAVRSRDGLLQWYEESHDRSPLSLRARRAFELLAGARLEYGCTDDARHVERLAAIEDWSAIVDEGWRVRPGAEAVLSLERAMAAARMAPRPEHVETDGAMGLCNRCGAAWIPGPNQGAGPVTWRHLRVKLAGFLEAHRPCGIARADGRVGLAPWPGEERRPAPPIHPIARPRAVLRFLLPIQPRELRPETVLADRRIGPVL